MRGVVFSLELYRSVINPKQLHRVTNIRWADARDLGRMNYHTRERIYDGIYMSTFAAVNPAQYEVERKFDAWNYE